MIAFWWHDLRARTCFPLSWHSSLIIYGRSFLSNHFLFATSKGALSFPATLIFIKVSKLTHPPDFSIGRRRERKSEVSSFGFNVVFVSSFFMKSFAWLVCSLPSYSMDHDHVALISWMLYNEPLVFKWQTNSFFWKFQKLRLSVVSSTQDHSKMSLPTYDIAYRHKLKSFKSVFSTWWEVVNVNTGWFSRSRTWVGLHSIWIFHSSYPAWL